MYWGGQMILGDMNGWLELKLASIEQVIETFGDQGMNYDCD